MNIKVEGKEEKERRKEEKEQGEGERGGEEKNLVCDIIWST